MSKIATITPVLRLLVTTIFLTVSTPGSAAAATVIADTLGSGPNIGSYYFTTYGPAFLFVPTDTVLVTDVALGFRYGQQPTFDTLIEIREDIFGIVPGDVIEVISDPCLGCNSAQPETRVFNFSGTTLLEAGQPYWLAVRSGVDPSLGIQFFWHLGTPSIFGTAAIRTSFDTFWTSSANPNAGVASFKISGVLIPVPPAIGLFGSALGLLGWMRRR